MLTQSNRTKFSNIIAAASKEILTFSSSVKDTIIHFGCQGLNNTNYLFKKHDCDMNNLGLVEYGRY